MSVAIIITFCVLLLIAYVFDLTASKTKIPSVILLLLLGWVVKQLTTLLDIHLPNFSEALPILGTLGLILIVLEGSLDLELNRSKLGLVSKSVFAILPMVALAFLLAFLFNYYDGGDFKNSLINAIPFCVISSAIAIPSVRHLSDSDKDFVVYESSLSDVFGVLLFNFLALNLTIDSYAFFDFGVQIIVITLISFVATIGLSFLLSKIEHHVKFIPIILLIILIYEVSKIYHLAGLIFILIFGLFLGNLDELKNVKFIQRFKPEELDKEVGKFKELINEGTFLVRALFFLLFGYLIETSEVLNMDSLVWAVSIVVLIVCLRAIQLKLSNLPLSPLLFVAPRGLITILLFLSIDPGQQISVVSNSLIIQVIILTAFLMMIGLMTASKKDDKTFMTEDKDDGGQKSF